MRPIRRLETACVGSGISADAGTAETIVENRKLRDPAAALLVNGQAAPADTGWSARLDQVRWLHVAGAGGYVFSEAVTLHGLREDRTATWREINLKYSTDTSVTRPYLTLWQDHGTAPEGAGYFWLQAPMASAERTGQWSSAPPVKLVARSTAVHAVRRCADGLLAANFWTAGVVQELAADGRWWPAVPGRGRTVRRGRGRRRRPGRCDRRPRSLRHSCLVRACPLVTRTRRPDQGSRRGVAFTAAGCPAAVAAPPPAGRARRPPGPCRAVRGSAPRRCGRRGCRGGRRPGPGSAPRRPAGRR